MGYVRTLTRSAVLCVPLVATGWISLMVGAPGLGTYTLQNYETVLTDPFGLRVLGNTLVLAVGSTLLALAIGAPLTFVTGGDGWLSAAAWVILIGAAVTLATRVVAARRELG